MTAEPTEARPLAGKVCLVTGATTGIGRVTAAELARRGARVWLGCRSEDRGHTVARAIAAETGNDAVAVLGLELGSFARVRAAAATWLAEDEPLHLLVNNAGVAGTRGVTEDGFELAFGTNHLGHFLLTALLLPRLLASAPARVVTVASSAHHQVRGIDWGRVRGRTRSLTGTREYAVSKLANVLFTAELARRLAGRGVAAFSLHPGAVASDIWRRVPQPFRWLLTRAFLTVEEGALTSLHCATAPGLEPDSGRYFVRSAPKEPSRSARDLGLARELWDRSVAFTGVDPAPLPPA